MKHSYTQENTSNNVRKKGGKLGKGRRLQRKAVGWKTESDCRIAPRGRTYTIRGTRGEEHSEKASEEDGLVARSKVD